MRAGVGPVTTCCIAVMGHVDHGKTALMRALTGIETDRLAEEKARGLSILPGFAHLPLAGGVLDFIDLPGHADFTPAMVAGACGAQAALLVIDAREGIAAQTVEHLRIARLLGISSGVVAVSKADLLERGALAARLADLRGALAGTFLANAPMIACSARTGAGLPELEAALATLLGVARPDAPLEALLPIDRAFTLAGQGTVVTGTLLGAPLQPGGKMRLHPLDLPVTLRTLHSRGEARAQVHPGERVAVNLRGIAAGDIPRGAVLGTDMVGQASACMDIALKVEPDAARPLKHMQQLRMLVGTASTVAYLRLYGGGTLAQGATGLAQLRFDARVFAYAGQHAVLRALSPAATVAGATVLDPQALPTRAGDAARAAVLAAAHEGEQDTIAEALIAARGGAAPMSEIALLARRSVVQTARTLGPQFTALAQGEITLRAQLDAGRRAILDALAAYHDAHPLEATSPRAVLPRLPPALAAHILAALRARGEIRLTGERIALHAHDPMAHLSAVDEARMLELAEELRAAGLAPPPALRADPHDAALLALLEAQGIVLRLANIALGQELLFHHETLSQAAVTLAAQFPPPQDFTVSQARLALGATRRIIVPLLEYFDAHGVTHRDGDLRQMVLSPCAPPR